MHNFQQPSFFSVPRLDDDAPSILLCPYSPRSFQFLLRAKSVYKYVHSQQHKLLPAHATHRRRVHRRVVEGRLRRLRRAQLDALLDVPDDRLAVEARRDERRARRVERDATNAVDVAPQNGPARRVPLASFLGVQPTRLRRDAPKPNCSIARRRR